MSNRYEINVLKASKRKNFVVEIKDNNTGKIYNVKLIRTYGTFDEIEEYKNNNPELNIFDVGHYKNISDIIITDIPKELKNEYFYIELCKKDGRFLQYIEDEDKTLDICMAAVKSTPIALRHVPEKYKVYDIICVALTSNGVTLQFIKLDKRTEEYCLLALQSSPNALRYFPETLKSLKICIDTVKRDMSCIKYVPDIFLLEVYQESILNIGLALPTEEDKQYRDLKDTIIKIKKLLHANIYMNYLELEKQYVIDEENGWNENLKKLLAEKNDLLNRLLELQVRINKEMNKIIPDESKKKI